MSLLLAAVVSAEPPEGMVLIPEGKFEMGRAHALRDDGLKWVPVLVRDDKPIRIISLDAFYLDRHEVTSRAYAEFAAETHAPAPYYWAGEHPPERRADEPVANVTWDEAAAYCARRGGRLPTEAEWERAARGGLTAKRYPWGDEEPAGGESNEDGESADEEPAPKRARFDAVDGPVKVCQYPENGFGLCDMAGNVWEWTADWYDRRAYDSLEAKNPKGPDSGVYRVLRGGSWADASKYLTNAHRSYARPDERSPNIGFRCAQDVPEK